LLIGITVGVLIGVVTGVILLVLLKTSHGARVDNVSAVAAIVSEMAAIPTFWFGGPWLTTKILLLVPLEDMINPYVVSLSISFLLFVSVPLFRWIGQSARELGEEARR